MGEAMPLKLTRYGPLLILLAGALFVGSPSLVSASGACPYWIDSATGEKVATKTIPAALGETAYSHYIQSSDRNHAQQSGQNFVRLPDGNWIDSATGQKVATKTIPAVLGETAYSHYIQSSDRNHAYQSGQNFVLIPCPPANQPANARAAPGLPVLPFGLGIGFGKGHGGGDCRGRMCDEARPK